MTNPRDIGPVDLGAGIEQAPTDAYDPPVYPLPLARQREVAGNGLDLLSVEEGCLRHEYLGGRPRVAPGGAWQVGVIRLVPWLQAQRDGSGIRIASDGVFSPPLDRAERLGNLRAGESGERREDAGDPCREICRLRIETFTGRIGEGRDELLPGLSSLCGIQDHEAFGRL
jgi:hypothetical protein